jgi:hypothetical protein
MTLLNPFAEPFLPRVCISEPKKTQNRKHHKIPKEKKSDNVMREARLIIMLNGRECMVPEEISTKIREKQKKSQSDNLLIDEHTNVAKKDSNPLIIPEDKLKALVSLSIEKDHIKLLSYLFSKAEKGNLLRELIEAYEAEQLADKHWLWKIFLFMLKEGSKEEITASSKESSDDINSKTNDLLLSDCRQILAEHNKEIVLEMFNCLLKVLEFYSSHPDLLFLL